MRKERRNQQRHQQQPYQRPAYWKNNARQQQQQRPAPGNFHPNPSRRFTDGGRKLEDNGKQFHQGRHSHLQQRPHWQHWQQQQHQHSQQQHHQQHKQHQQPQQQQQQHQEGHKPLQQERKPDTFSSSFNTMATMEAVLSTYNTDGVWQSQKEITMERVGLSRTYLQPGEKYKCMKLSTELGPDKKTKLCSWSNPKGRVCFQEKTYAFENNEKRVAPELLLDMAVRAGAIAFVARQGFSNKSMVGKVHPIPVFILRGDVYVEGVYSEGWMPCQDLCFKDSSPSDKAAETDLSELIKEQRVSSAVIQQLKWCGVQTNEDASKIFLDQKERLYQQKLKDKEEQELQQSETRILFPVNFCLKEVGVGGLGEDFEVVFRRLFASRMFSPAKIAMLGISHVRGLLLVGPPGCGKTLLARQLSKLLKTKQTKILSGPEVFNKWLGQSEENVRDLFKEAEEEWHEKGERSGLHVIIIDEIDAMCRRRSNGGDGSDRGQRTLESVVNQMLAKMDGVEQIHNILIIGMTNRMEAIDPALLRPGRFELKLHINLPDEKGRLEILGIHTSKMQEGGLLDREAATRILSDIAKRTEGFSGAELESIVKGACSIAMDRCLDPDNLSAPPDESKLVLTSSDFCHAVEMVKASKAKTSA